MNMCNIWKSEFESRGFKIRTFDWCENNYFEFRGNGIIGFYDEYRYLGYIECDNILVFNKQSQCCMRLKLPKNPNSRSSRRFWNKFYIGIAYLSVNKEPAARSWGSGNFIWED